MQPSVISEARRWILDPRYSVVESGFRVSNDRPGYSGFIGVAQCVSLLPSSEGESPEPIPMLNRERDDVFEVCLYQELESAHPAEVGYINALIVDCQYRGKGFASKAKEMALAEILAANTRRPTGRRIRFMVGKVFSIQGVQRLGGDEDADRVMLSDIGLGEVTNIRSMKANMRCKRWPASCVGKWKGGAPVAVPAFSCSLIVEWYYLVLRLDNNVSQDRSCSTESDILFDGR